MERQDKAENHIQAFEDREAARAPPKVSDLVKVLEKTLNASHFLNTRFNSQNTTLCEKLMKAEKRADGSHAPLNKELQNAPEDGASEGCAGRK
ncbi:uncharacterized protein NEMAJ01_0860 [Nematocida major]|uniref:uncharacterized protein n=1 Tax=Nematocida major TaxID=1912982 RepID=UPI0020077359|nr:uncharacterized protein NEMAJ01_0860 [Nematocida major]KAH9385964.1 hypothetical protein NEMAJ01_0860 [Nematocida major]